MLRVRLKDCCVVDVDLCAYRKTSRGSTPGLFLTSRRRCFSSQTLCIKVVKSDDTFLTDWNGGILGPIGVSKTMFAASCSVPFLAGARN